MRRVMVSLLMGIVVSTTSFLSGCATVRQVDDKTADAKLDELKKATLLTDSTIKVRELADLYYATKRTLEKDILGGGDNLTNLGILGGIAAVADAGIGYFKVLGVGAGVLGTYDVRYKPGQQRQFYLDATLALGCIAGRADKLSLEKKTLEGLIPVTATSMNTLLATGEQVQAANALVDAPRDTYVQVLQVHRRLDEKVFSVVSTQGFTSIRDNLVKNAVDAQKAAENVKGQSMSLTAQNSAIGLASLRSASGAALTAEAQGKLTEIGSQLARTLADATTYKTDIAACSADFLK